MFTKIATAALALTVIVGASAATTSQAEAKNGALIAGLVGGAIIGGAVAAHAYSAPHYYAPGYYAPGYYAPAPVYVKPCQKVWVDNGWGQMVKVKSCY